MTKRRSRLRTSLLALGVAFVVSELASRVWLAYHPEAGIGYLPRYAQAAVRERAALDRDPNDPGKLVFLFGGSTMQGVPYNPTLTPSKWIDAFVDELYPEAGVDVVNFGLGGAASPYLAEAVRGTLENAPDLVVVMLGNNEFLKREESRSGAVEGVKSVARATAVGRLVDDIARSVRDRLELARMYRDVKKQLARAANSAEPSEPAGGGELDDAYAEAEAEGWESQFLRRVRRPERVPGSPESTALVDQMRGHLVAIIESCRERTVPLLVVTPPFNMRHLPNASCFEAQGEQLEEWKEHVRRGLEHCEREEPVAALAEFQRALQLDGTNARLWFHVAECLEAVGDVEGAVRHYLSAGEYDVRRSHIIGEVEAVIRAVCAEHDVPYRNLHDAFMRIDDDGIVGFDLIVDNAHPSPRGQYELARELLRFLHTDSDVLPRTPAPNPGGFETVLGTFPLGTDFEYQVHRRLGDYHRSEFDKALTYYETAYEARQTPEICLRLIELCHRRGRVEEARRWVEELAALTAP